LIYPTESLTGRGSAPERLAHVHPQAGTDETDAPPDAGRPSENEAGPGEEAKPKRKKLPGGNYFTVCPHTFAKALALGIKPALAWLTLECGTKGHNRTTRWSAEAIETRGLMGRRSAHNALRTVEEAGLTSVRDKRNLRTLAPYFCREKAELLYLPNRLIGAVLGDISPLKPLAEMDAATGTSALALLMEIYCRCHLVVDHGCNPSLISERWPLKFLGQERGAHRIYGREQKGEWHYHPQPSPLPIPSREAAGDILNILCDLNLVRVVKYAFTHPPEREGEKLFPVCCFEGEEAENTYGQAHSQAARLALERTARNQKEKDKLAQGFQDFVAVRRHVSAPLLVGLVRPRWMQDTSDSRQWLAKLQEWKVFAKLDAEEIHSR
jgi:hypothetical protein